MVNPGVCNFCGDLTSSKVCFYSGADENICASCVKKFNAVIDDYEEAKQELRSKVIVAFPHPEHSFTVIDGGKSD